jgi:hypothetical protein
MLSLEEWQLGSERYKKGLLSGLDETRRSPLPSTIVINQNAYLRGLELVAGGSRVSYHGPWILIRKAVGETSKCR